MSAPNWPTPPSGPSPVASFFRRLVDCCKRIRPIVGPGLVSRETPDGVIISLAQSSSFSASAKAQLYKITGLTGGDYFFAQLFVNGQTVGPITSIAKSIKVQHIASEIIDGFPITYTYSGDNDRTASSPMLGSEAQVCHPRYQVGDLVYILQIQNGTQVNDGTNRQILLYEISPARFFCSTPSDYTPPV